MNKENAVSALMAKVEINQETKCWIWRGYIEKNGYGKVTVDTRRDWAHRHMYRLIVGEIPVGLELDHTCRNTYCINPAHLEPVTHAENMRRAPYSACTIHGVKTHCPQGHPYSGDNLIVWGGFRYCRTCQNKYKKAYKAKIRNEKHKCS